MQKVCIVIPCYNEGKRIPTDEFSEFINTSDNINFIFVNDGSKDNTIEVLKNLKNIYDDRIRILDLEQNRGKAEAVRRGILESLKWMDFEAAGYFDADLSTPLFEIINLEKALLKTNDIKIAFGSRVKILSNNIIRNNYRHYFGRVFATFASIILGLGIYDTQCGAKLIRGNIIPEVFNIPFKSKWFFDIEIFFRIKKITGNDDASKHMVEMPLNQWIEKGESKISFFYWLKVPYELLKIYIAYKKY
jgi:dolichyl-phosphate beta-glucosyltransferase